MLRKVLSLVLGLILFSATAAQAATPGAPSFELKFSPLTGGASDNTGDGGGGTNPYRFQEYYIGQTFKVTVVLRTGSEAVSGGDARMDIPDGWLSCALDSSVHAFGGVLKLEVQTPGPTTPDLPVGWSRYWIVNSASGTETLTSVNPIDFVAMNCTVLDQREAMLDTNDPLPINFYFTGPGNTLDSNIASPTKGDVLANAENALIYLWPDTNKPYGTPNSPINGATNIIVTTSPNFYLYDRNTTSGDETGLYTADFQATYRTVSGVALNGGAVTNVSTTWSSWSGTWSPGNQVLGTTSPPVIGGTSSTRRLSYATVYEFCLNDGKDNAMLPGTPPTIYQRNVMDQVCYQFTTEADINPPQIVSNAPVTPTIAPTNTNISFQIRDIKGVTTSIPGVGVDINSFTVNIKALKEGDIPIDINVKCSDAGVTCTPATATALENGTYQTYNVVIDPSFFAGANAFDHFAQDITVKVKVTGAADMVGNIASDFEWEFRIADVTPPEIINLFPAPDDTYCNLENNLLSFEVVDSGVGVLPTDIVVRIRDDFYQIGGANDSLITMTASSSAKHQYVVVNPLIDLTTISFPFAVTIDVTDQAHNALSPSALYALYNDCAECALGCEGDGVCNPECIYDPDCEPYPPDPEFCAADDFCDPQCLDDPDCEDGTNCNPSFCATDDYCDPRCVYDADCEPYPPAPIFCGTDDYCDSRCIYDADCEPYPPTPIFCGTDDFCDARCLNDPDCPNGTNCSQSPPPSCPPGPSCPSCPPRDCSSSSNCDGKNYESCSSCCPQSPQLNCPSYPTTPEIIYRVREVCSSTESEPTVKFETPNVEVDYALQTAGYRISNPDQCPATNNNCGLKNQSWSVWFPWLLVLILTGTTCHHAYHRRLLKEELAEYEKLQRKTNKENL